MISENEMESLHQILRASKCTDAASKKMMQEGEMIQLIPESFRTPRMIEHLIMLGESGYGENIKDLVRHYRLFFLAYREGIPENKIQERVNQEILPGYGRYARAGMYQG